MKMTSSRSTVFFFSSRRRHTRFDCDWSSDVCSSDLPSGVRVVNVFPGPIDDEWNQLLPPPKVAAAGLADAIVRALRDGVEDVYPGDVAQEWLARWRDNPKALERELSS